jgi:3-oxoacyl-[acyl-carrier-protein] synthase III
MCGEEFRDTDFISVPIAGSIAPVDMAVRAARQAVQRLAPDHLNIDLLLHSSIAWSGPEGWAPSGYILRELGHGSGTGYEIYQGCNGMLSSLEVAAGLMALAPAPTTAMLTTAVNASTSTVDRWSSAGVGVAMGDGATAAILGNDDGFARVDSICSMMLSDLEAIYRGNTPLRQDTEARPKMEVAARLKEFEASTQQKSIDLQRRFAKAYSDVAWMALNDVGIRPYEIARVLFSHIGVYQTLVSIMLPLRLPIRRSTAEFGRTVGHLGAGDHVASLDNLLTTGQLSPGDRLLLIGGTAGFNVASAVLTITETSPSWS